jgi:hypothetical protein
MISLGDSAAHHFFGFKVLLLGLNIATLP